MPRSRDIPKQIREPFESSIPTKTMQSSENITDLRRLNRIDIKIPEFLPSDPEIWFNIFDNIKRKRNN